MEAEAARRAVLVRVKGRVQGVGYRQWALRMGTDLGLDGWVRNRRDGSVEALFSGPAEQVETMLARCGSGPRAAVVTGVETTRTEPPDIAGFEVLPTL
ncbi:MAG: acylphosphatase [Hyphomicrobiaceae bacterium]|nr:acylphosphatase [Hyphomicrobiaceae bacterium]